MSDRHAWTAEEDARLRDLYPRTRSTELEARFPGRSKSSIKNRVATLRLRKNDDVSMRRPARAWEDQVLRELYPNTKTEKVAARLGWTVSRTYQRAKKLGLEKTPEYLASPDACRLRRGGNVGARFRFPKGHVPANKGLRRPGYAPGRMAETQFKKGQPTRWMPVGSERLVAGYRYTKVSDIRNVPWTRNWVATHILLWEKENGPLNRRTHALLFKNGDRKDVRLENLELITRGDLVRRNSVHKLPPELKKAVYAIGTLRAQITKKTKRLAREKQNRRSA